MFTITVDSIHDIRVFILSLICGVLSGIVLDFFRASRRCFKLGKTGVAIQDIITVAAVFFMFSYVVTAKNDGSVRWFEFAGTVMGLILYYCTISGGVMNFMVCIMIYILRTYLFGKRVYMKILGRIRHIYGIVKGGIVRIFRHKRIE